MDRFGDLTPAPDEVFYGRRDPNDVRLGEIVARSVTGYPAAEVVIVGCPQDEGVCRNRGRAGARRAPNAIRRALYRYPVCDDLKRVMLVDVGDVLVHGSLEETHERLNRVVRMILADGKRAVVFGGGNDISYPDCVALASHVDRPLVLNIDRHLDVRADTPRNSGTAYRQLLEEGHVDPMCFHEIGINTFANSVTYQEYVEQAGATIHLLGDLRRQGVGSTVASILGRSDADGVFFGFDLDVVRAVEAPGVSDPGPMGLTAREVCEVADEAAKDPRTRIVEITEVNPDYDRDGITAKLAANIVVRALVGGG